MEVAELQENVILLGDRVLIKPDEWEEKTRGGIYIPDTSRQRVQRGTVKHIGPECKHLKIGDRVIYPRWASADIKLSGIIHYLFNESQIHGVLSGEAIAGEP